MVRKLGDIIVFGSQANLSLCNEVDCNHCGRPVVTLNGIEDVLFSDLFGAIWVLDENHDHLLEEAKISHADLDGYWDAIIKILATAIDEEQMVEMLEEALPDLLLNVYNDLCLRELIFSNPTATIIYEEFAKKFGDEFGQIMAESFLDQAIQHAESGGDDSEVMTFLVGYDEEATAEQIAEIEGIVEQINKRIESELFPYPPYDQFGKHGPNDPKGKYN